jgi:hypothetical protein
MPIDEKLPKPTTTELERIDGVLREMGGPNVVWGAGSRLEVWMVEQRAKQDAAISRRLLVASWALVAATVALCVATIGLILVAHVSIP